MNIEQDLIGEIKGLNIIIKRKMFEQYKDKDRQPSPLQFKILAYLAHHSDEEVNQKNLEESLNVNKATISGALNTMEKQGLIKRTTSSIDERAKSIRMTELSKERLEEMDANYKEINEGLCNKLSKKEIEDFLYTLEKMKTYLEGGKND